MTEASDPFSAYSRLISRRALLSGVTAFSTGAVFAPALVPGFAAKAHTATPSAEPPSAEAPAIGTADQTRGAAGELTLLQRARPSTLSVHNTTRPQNLIPAALVTEPLMHFLPDGTPVPCLVESVPSRANGLLADDLTLVTYRLKAGTVWSDGTPLTAADVVFTWRWIMDDVNQSVSQPFYSTVTDVTALNDCEVTITFDAPNPWWFTLFAGTNSGGIYPEHILAKDPSALDAFVRNPIGTGPYVVEELIVNDDITISFVANERYREPNKPAFSRITLIGGGDSVSASRAVIEDGAADAAFLLHHGSTAENLELSANGMNDLLTIPGTFVEHLVLNLADRETIIDEQQSHWQTDHPILSDPAVRRALALGVDRAAISEQLFAGPAEPPTANVLVGVDAYESPDSTWAFDLEEGRRLLDAAGWVSDGGVRVKNGVELSLTFMVPNQPPYPELQAIIVEGWEALGVRVDAQTSNPDLYYNLSPGNEVSHAHQYHFDVSIGAKGMLTPNPTHLLKSWWSDDGANIAQRENLWLAQNISRYHNPDYDDLYESLRTETDPDQIAQTVIAMNDVLIDGAIIIPLVQRAADVAALSPTLRAKVVAAGPFEPITWNIANWNRGDES